MTFLSPPVFYLTLPQSPTSLGVFWDQGADGKCHFYIHAPLVQASRIVKIISEVVEKRLHGSRLDDFYIRKVSVDEMAKGRFLDLPPLIIKDTSPINGSVSTKECIIKFNHKNCIFHFGFTPSHDKKGELEADIILFFKKTDPVFDSYISPFHWGYPPLEELIGGLGQEQKDFLKIVFPKMRSNALYLYLGKIVARWSRFERLAYLKSSVSGVKRSRFDELKEKVLEVEEYKKQQRNKLIAPLIKKHMQPLYASYPKGLEITYEDFSAFFSANPKKVEDQVLLKSNYNDKKSREITRLFLTFFKTPEPGLDYKSFDLSSFVEEGLLDLEEEDKILYRAQIVGLIATLFNYERAASVFQESATKDTESFEIVRKIGFASMKIAKVIYETDLAIKVCRDALFERRKGLFETRVQGCKLATL